jgi:hypothetical protein
VGRTISIANGLIFLLFAAAAKALNRRESTALVEEKQKAEGASSQLAPEDTPSLLNTFIISKDNDKFLAALSFLITVAALTVGLSNGFLAISLSLLALFLSFLIGRELYKRLPDADPGATRKERFYFLFSNSLALFKYGVIAAFFILSLYVILQYREFIEPYIRYSKSIGDTAETQWLEFTSLTLLAMWFLFLFLVAIFDVFDTVFRFRQWMKRHRLVQLFVVPILTLLLFISAYSTASAINGWVYNVGPIVTGNHRLQEQKLRENLRQRIDLTVIKKEIDSDGQYASIELLVVNHSGKDVEAFEGALEFRDILSDTIKRLRIKEIVSIRANDRKSFTYKLKLNQGADEGKDFMNTELKNLRVFWFPERVVYSDKTASYLPLKNDG